MNKILNWTFGACFRTLGRFLAIFIVGVLLIFIGSKIGIELPDWLTLRVNATTNPGWASELPALGRSDIKECSNSTTCNTTKETYTDYFESPVIQRAFITHDEWSMSIGNNGYSIISPYSTKANYLYSAMYYVCFNKNIDTTNRNSIFASSSGNAVNLGNLYNSVVGRSALGTEPIIDGGRTFGRCYIYNGYFVSDTNYNWVTLRIQSDTLVSGVYASVIALDVRELGLWDEKFIDLINNSGLASAESVEQVQQSVNQVQQEIQQTQDTITNEDTTGAEDSASGFFNDFTTETFGLTAIITAPLNAINSLISSTCSPLVFPLPYVDKNLSLPCMSSIYSEFFGGFFSIYQLITTGIISYYVIVRIFNLVKDFKNPDHDEIEVVDL